MQEDADRELREFDQRIKARELAEKRRLAPGWLDSEMHILEPEKSTPVQQQDTGNVTESQDTQNAQNGNATTDQGAELDRAFGGMELK